MIRNLIYITIIGAGLLACSSVDAVSDASELIPVTDTFESANSVDSLVTPYRIEMQGEMDSVIAIAEYDFLRGRPNGVLNNWSTDAVLKETIKWAGTPNAPYFCLLNWGGLRNPIDAGEVTVGDIFKVMPFDNQAVLVEMPITELQAIAEYIEKKNGEPIAGAVYENGSLIIDGMTGDEKTFWVITSDYLMNGGDKMYFFKNKISFVETGKLLRDIMMEAAFEEKVLNYSTENRIKL